MSAWTSGVLMLGLGGVLLLHLAIGRRHAERHLLFAMVAGFVVLVLSKPLWRRWKPLALVSLCLGAALGILVADVSLSGGPRREELPNDGYALVREIEVFRARSGRYPRDLAEAGLTPGWNRFGGWHYEPRHEGASFHLWCGDYTQDEFVLFWYPEVGNWDWDT